MVKHLFTIIVFLFIYSLYSCFNLYGENRNEVIVYNEDLKVEEDILIEKTEIVYVDIYQETHPSSLKGFAMNIKTNLLYDGGLIPNIGVEFRLPENFSISANWMYAWWENKNSTKFWRIYGGDVGFYWWFGKKAHQRIFTGHHIGISSQMITYDFKTGKKGYLTPKWSWGASLNYGYSFRIGAHLNLDLGLGIGYLQGKRDEYIKTDSHYVWQSRKKYHWIGPTKAEVSLVWIIGPFQS